MSVDDLCAIPAKNVVADDVVLFLWAKRSALDEHIDSGHTLIGYVLLDAGK